MATTVVAPMNVYTAREILASAARFLGFTLAGLLSFLTTVGAIVLVIAGVTVVIKALAEA